MKPSNHRRTALHLCTLVLASLMAVRAHAYAFDPTDAEFNAWPSYCKARYVVTRIGEVSRFITQVDANTRAAAEAALGSPTYLHVHHYCAGLIHFARSRLEPDPERKRFQLDEARAEMLFSLRGDPKDSPLHSTMLVNLAMVERERGEIAVARKILEEAIVIRPSDPTLYLGLAIILRGEKDLGSARTVLESGLQALQYRSPELHYNLGLVCFELADYDCALEHAQVAYQEGYPLAALKNRLAGRGLWKQD